MRASSFSLSASQRLNSIRFPAKAAMQLLTTLFVVFLSLCLFPNLAAAASPHIYDVPQAGPPGSQTTLVGNGWDPNATLDIYFDSTDVGLVDTDNNGSFGHGAEGADHSAKRTHDTDTQRRGSGPTLDHRRRTDYSATGAGSRSPSVIDWPQFHFDASTPALTLMRTF